RSAVLSFKTCSFVWVATGSKTNREASGCATAEAHAAVDSATGGRSQRRQVSGEERGDDRGLPIAQLCVEVLEPPPLRGARPVLRQQAHRQLRVRARESEPVEVEFDPSHQGLGRRQ